MGKIEKMAELSHRRSMTKKQLKAERNATRTTWEGCRSTVMLTKKDKKSSDRQKVKASLRAYCCC